MVGSTALSGKVDPELLGALIRRYQDAVAGAIGRYGGFVAKFMGDGVLAYFGFPRAFEDAAERAVRAAIGILAEVGDIECRTARGCRHGSASPPASSWSAKSSAPASRKSAPSSAKPPISPRGCRRSPGPTPSSSARRRRICWAACSSSSHTGEHELKGFARPVPAWRVIGEATVESRFAAIRTGEHLPLIGRAHEMGLMLERWQLARQGEGQIVTVIGEAGIGKSRSIEALQEDARRRAACAHQFAVLTLSQRQRALSGDPISQSRRRLRAQPIQSGARGSRNSARCSARRDRIGSGRDSAAGRAVVDPVGRRRNLRRKRRRNARRRRLP